jgi:hypothetical protein
LWVACRCTRPEVDGLQFDAHRKFEARRPQCEVQQPFGSVFSRAAVGHEPPMVNVSFVASQ